jgi:hypothetical protein
MFGKWYCDRDQIILVKLDVADLRPDCVRSDTGGEFGGSAANFRESSAASI